MSLLTSISNKLQYTIAKNTSDPEADAYAKEQAEQAAQDAKAAKSIKRAADKKAKQVAAKKLADEKAAALAARSKFDLKKLSGDTASGVLNKFKSLLLISFLLYGASLAANEAIGYNVPFRVLSFVYGIILSIYYVLKALYTVYWKNEKIPYYSFFPISTHVPNGDFEKIFLGPFCYEENTESQAAKALVQELYLKGFQKSVENTNKLIGAAVAVGSATTGVGGQAK